MAAVGEEVRLASFVGYVGAIFQDSIYGIANVYPSEEVSAAGRTVAHCLIRPYEDRLRLSHGVGAVRAPAARPERSGGAAFATA